VPATDRSVCAFRANYAASVNWVAEKEMSCVVVTAPNTNETDRLATAILNRL
jgi:hypothetical protein